MGVPWGTRDERHAMAGLSHTGSPQVAGDGAHLGLGDARLQQGRTHAALARRRHAGTEVPQVARVVAVGDDGPALRGGDGVQVVVEVGLAEVAAIGGVGGIVGVEVLLRGHEAVGDGPSAPPGRRRRAARASGSWGRRRCRPAPARPIARGPRRPPARCQRPQNRRRGPTRTTARGCAAFPACAP